MSTVLEVEDLTVRAARGLAGAELVAGIDFTVPEGEVLTFIGETGSGKSLVAQAICRALPPGLSATGSIRFRGRDLLCLPGREVRALWGRRILLVPQEPLEALDPTMTVRRQVAEVFRFLRGRTPRRAMREAGEVLCDLGLAEATGAGAYPCRLSGGMNQRVLFAMALAAPAELILVDEPTKGLDPTHREIVIGMLARLLAGGKTLVCITHDLHVAARLGGRVSVLFDGVVVEEGPAGKVLTGPSHPYTQGLCRAVPERGLVPIPEEVLRESARRGSREGGAP